MRNKIELDEDVYHAELDCEWWGGFTMGLIAMAVACTIIYFLNKLL
jgi:hypothetical protein